MNAEQDKALPTKPVIIIKVTRDNLEAELQFQRSGVDTADPLFEDVLDMLAEQGITFGVNESNLRHLCSSPTYNRVFVIARGDPPQTGNDGRLNFLVRTTRELRPKIREDGTADFKDLGLIQNVHAGQPLCEIYPPEQGADGMDIRGNVLPGLFGRESIAPVGLNTEIVQENGIAVLKATLDGDVDYKSGVINVIDVLRIKGNVDNSTGDINFVGDVIVGGDVVSGFNITSAGSIQVKGSVEGATLDAQGDITISEGVNGMNRGVLRARGNIKCKYMQSCLIKAENNIYSDTLMYCTVECGGDMELSGKRAALIGGRSSIAGRLLAKTIGTTTHTTTDITMCATGMKKNEEVLSLTQKIKELDAELTKLVQVMTRFEGIGKKVQLTSDQLQGVSSVKASYMQTSQHRKDTQAALEQLKREQMEASTEGSYIECRERVHTGVRISFGPLVLNVTESFVHSRIHVVEGEITMSTL